MRKKGFLLPLLNETVETRLLYLDRNLTLETLARELSTNRTYIYDAISSIGMNYSTYINSYRTQYAIDLLLDSRRQNLSVDDVAEISGFSSPRQMNFYIKKSAGVTARALRKRIFDN